MAKILELDVKILLKSRRFGNAFRSLASKCFPSGCSKSVCVRPPALRKLRTDDVDFANDA